MAPSFRARSPLLLSADGGSNSSLSTVEYYLPTTTELIGQWHMVASSSSFWTAGKHDVSIVYEDTTTQSKSPPGTLNDTASYYSGSPPTQHSTRGISSPSASAPGVYNWRGVGWLRMVTTRWEMVGFGSLLGSNDGTDLLVTFAQKTIFSPQSLSIYCKEKPQVSNDEVIQRVSDVLKQMGNAALSDEVDRLQAIP
ncbi:hypothetical protein F5X96DRAFT_666580 [Biscogniauxia mediterranea]|nr:hypothetical protein F5X96DRAFT_666580 [Biscogniauxia mediterranea]